MKLYETQIVELGSEATMFKAENMMILFGKDAPAELADYSYIIDVTPVEHDIKPGMVMKFDDISFTITSVGNVVAKNLSNLGHITLKFDGATEAELPGTLYLEAGEVPEVGAGTRITIEG